MKVTREQATENREKVLETASRLFRERGFDGIGVADLMSAAGLTHGAFYGQFESKDDLVAQACERAMLQSGPKWDRVLEGRKGPAAIKALRELYLTRAHVENPATGCTLPTLAAEAPRRGARVQRTFTEGVNRLLGRITDVLPGSAAARRRKAIVVLSELVGALLLARAVDNEKLSDEILRAVRQD